MYARGNFETTHRLGYETVRVTDAEGLALAHDITEIRKDEFKGRAFKKGHVVRPDDIRHLQRLGKDRLFVLRLANDDMHEDDAVYALAAALMGEGVKIKGEAKEGKLNLVAERDGLLRVNRRALLEFNLLGDVMCATLHDNTLVKKGQVVAGTRAIPLVVKRKVVEKAVRAAENAGGILEVKALRKPKAGIVVTGNEIYHKRIKDAFAPVIIEKIEACGGEIAGLHYAPDDEKFIAERLKDLLAAGADLLITTGGMSVDPDDVTRFAIRSLGAINLTYGSPVLPGAMFLTAYLPNPEKERRGSNGGAAGCEAVPIIGIPACGMYAKMTVFDIVLPRILAGEQVGRAALAELGHGGLCMKCRECRYPMCPFGK